MTSRLLALTAFAVLAASNAFGEADKINVHLEPGVGTGVSKAFFVSGAALKVDLGVLSFGPVSPQAEIFGLGTHDPLALDSGSLFGGGVGLRWRILNDEKGYWIMPQGGGKPGNLWGNLWLDADLVIANGGPRVGFDVALGGELSIIEGLQTGPFVKLYFVKDTALIFGLSFSIGGPAPAPPAEVDTDKDGIPDAKDKCPNEPEDKNGFEDEDGCPEPDADKDGIPDAKDKCPNEPEDKNGVDDDDGCPDAVISPAVVPEAAPPGDATPAPDATPKPDETPKPVVPPQPVVVPKP